MTTMFAGRHAFAGTHFQGMQSRTHGKWQLRADGQKQQVRTQVRTVMAVFDLG
jgi:hypothetical protein